MDAYQITVIVIAIILFIGFLWYIIYDVHKRRKKETQLENDFIQVIESSLGNDSIQDLKDVDDLYLGIYEGHHIRFNERSEIVLFLRKVKKSVSTRSEGKHGKRPEQLILINKLLLIAEEELKKEEQKVPFAGVPKPERSFLEDIYEISNTENKTIIMDKLNELASAIKVREQESNKYIDEQGVSLKLAKRGLLATISFSLVSIGLAIFFFLKSRGA